MESYLNEEELDLKVTNIYLVIGNFPFEEETALFFPFLGAFVFNFSLKSRTIHPTFSNIKKNQVVIFPKKGYKRNIWRKTEEIFYKNGKLPKLK